MLETRGASREEKSYADTVVTAFPLHRYTYADYLRLEEESSTRHEFLDGEIVAMAGGTPEHAAFAMAVGRQLGNQLEGSDCRVFSSDLRVRVEETGLATYPDVTVVCGATTRDPADSVTVLNPTVVVEVTSDSTEEYDRVAKLQHFQKIPSLQAVVIVSHREPLVEVWQRTDDAWSHTAARSGQQASISRLKAGLDVDALWAAAQEPQR